MDSDMREMEQAMQNMANQMGESGAAIAGTMIIISLILSLAGLVIGILYLLSLQKSLRLTFDHHGKAPALVWLSLIPAFNIVWQFFIVAWVSKGIKGRMEALGKNGGDGGWTIGLAMCILICCSIIPFVNLLTGPAALILWIIWWVKVAGFSSEISEASGPAEA